MRALGTDTRGAQIVRFTINGPLVHQALPVAAVIPAGASGQKRPLLVFLHGHGGSDEQILRLAPRLSRRQIERWRKFRQDVLEFWDQARQLRCLLAEGRAQHIRV